MQKEIVQPVSADTGAIEQFADNPSPCAPLTPSAETRYLKAMEQTDRYHCRYNPSYALLDNAEPAPVIPAAGVRPRTQMQNTRKPLNGLWHRFSVSADSPTSARRVSCC
ncbi:TPA: hypothetical protein ACNFOQ_002448 [Morganella morganii]